MSRPQTRAEFLLKSAFAVAGTSGIGAVGPFVSRALAQKTGGDIDVLQFAQTLEHLEVALYRHGAPLLKDGPALAYAQAFGAHQKEFVETLGATITKLGGAPVESPKFRFPKDTLTSFIALAAQVEDVGVAALNGAAPDISSKEVLAAAGSIVATEARHAAAWRMLAGETPTPAAFDEAFDRSTTLGALKPFLPAAG